MTSRHIQFRRSHRVRSSRITFFLKLAFVAALFFGLGELIVSPATKTTVGRVSQHSFVSHAAASPVALQVPVLMYHYIRIVPDPAKDRLGYNLSVTPEDFTRQMHYLVAHHFTTITPDDLDRARQGLEQLPPHPILLTFDDGYVDFYTTAFPILEQLHLKATAFIVTGFVGDKHGRYMTWDEIHTLDQSGLITIGAHTVNHVDLKTAPDAPAQIIDSKTTLEQMLHHPITSFAYPSGEYNSFVVNLVRSAGFDLAFTTHPGLVTGGGSDFELPRVRIAGGLPLDEFAARIEQSTTTARRVPFLKIPLGHPGVATGD